MACAIEDAGFQIRDQIMWLYGCGFPKSLNISKAIDKMAGVKQKIIGNKWDNFGTALKPAHEPIILARKPLSEKNIASNVLKHGTGGLNIDGCRVSTVGSLGRFPANVIHDGGDEVEAEFVRYGTSKSTAHVRHSTGTPSVALRNLGPYNSGGHADSGSASRFFYCAKASTKERSGSKHPTIKPLALMRYLCRLITPPNGTILDPFAGSGTTGQAAKLEGFDSILIEQSPEYIRHINKRLANDKEH
jgi:site-specific DNA-methyltransferase (adenine-specific)